MIIEQTKKIDAFVKALYPACTGVTIGGTGITFHGLSDAEAADALSQVTAKIATFQQESADEVAAIAADKLLMAQDLADNLPDWTTVDTAISSINDMADAKVFLRKLTRVVYGHIKGTTT